MIRLLLAVLVAWALTESSAFAHKLLVNSRVVGQELKIDVFYEDDSPADGAKVQLLLGETEVLTAKTDENGHLTVPIPQPGEYELRAEHYGHVEKKPVIIPSGENLPEANEENEPNDNLVYRLLSGLGFILVLSGVVRWIWIVVAARSK